MPTSGNLKPKARSAPLGVYRDCDDAKTSPDHALARPPQGELAVLTDYKGVCGSITGEPIRKMGRRFLITIQDWTMTFKRNRLLQTL